MVGEGGRGGSRMVWECKTNGSDLLVKRHSFQFFYNWGLCMICFEVYVSNHTLSFQYDMTSFKSQIME